MSEFPLLNGVAPSWTDIETTISAYNGPTLTLADYTAINWEEVVERGMTYGRGGRPKRRTTGKVSYTGSIEILRPGWRVLRTGLASVASKDNSGRPRISLVTFDILIQHEVPGDDEIYSVKLLGCQVLKRNGAYTEGVDAEVVSLDLSILSIEENGTVML